MKFRCEAVVASLVFRCILFICDFVPNKAAAVLLKSHQFCSDDLRKKKEVLK